VIIATTLFSGLSARLRRVRANDGVDEDSDDNDDVSGVDARRVRDGRQADGPPNADVAPQAGVPARAGVTPNEIAGLNGRERRAIPAEAKASPMPPPVPMGPSHSSPDDASPSHPSPNDFAPGALQDRPSDREHRHTFPGRTSSEFASDDLAADVGAALSGLGGDAPTGLATGVVSPLPFPQPEPDPWSRRVAMAPPAQDGQDVARASAALSVGATLKELRHLEKLKQVLRVSGDDVWRLHPPVRPVALDRIKTSRVPVIAFANLKGGVGKTTLAANLAAHYTARGKRVLLIDLDYQGSLSTNILRACGAIQVGASLIETVLRGESSWNWFRQNAVGLNARLPGACLVPAAHTLNALESRLLVNWLLEDDPEHDIRYALGRFLALPEVLGAFDVVLLDTPPRLSTATVNALAVATHLVIPTRLDGLSIDNIGPLLSQIDTWFRTDVNPGLEIAGVVGTMTHARILSNNERRVRALLENELMSASGAVPMFGAHIAERAALAKAAGNDLAYFTDTGRNSVQDMFDSLGEELSARIAATAAS